MKYKLTIDMILMDKEPQIPGMDTLKLWEREGKVDLTVVDRPKPSKNAEYGWPGAPPRTENKRKSKWSNQKGRIGKLPESGSVNFSRVSSVLFPTTTRTKLKMNEVNNIIHLINHHISKNVYFVTRNFGSFIDNGRRERLKTSFGIVVMTPEEMVKELAKLEKWKTSEKLNER